MARLDFERLTRDEIGLYAPSSVAILPTASIEQHGPHCPVGTDTMCCMAVARGAAERTGEDLRVFVCPPVHYAASHHHRPWPGVLSLKSTVFADVLQELLESLEVSGFRRVFILNGHGGNQFVIKQAANDFMLEYGHVQVVAESYWDVAREALEAVPTPGLVSVPGHAGDFETSLILYLDSTLVRRENIPVQAVPGGSSGWRGSGTSDDASKASAELGQKYLDAAVAEVANTVRSLAEGL